MFSVVVGPAVVKPQFPPSEVERDTLTIPTGMRVVALDGRLAREGAFNGSLTSGRGACDTSPVIDRFSPISGRLVGFDYPEVRDFFDTDE